MRGRIDVVSVREEGVVVERGPARGVFGCFVEERRRFLVAGGGVLMNVGRAPWSSGSVDVEKRASVPSSPALRMRDVLLWIARQLLAPRCA